MKSLLLPLPADLDPVTLEPRLSQGQVPPSAWSAPRLCLKWQPGLRPQFPPELSNSHPVVPHSLGQGQAVLQSEALGRGDLPPPPPHTGAAQCRRDVQGQPATGSLSASPREHSAGVDASQRRRAEAPDQHAHTSDEGDRDRSSEPTHLQTQQRDHTRDHTCDGIKAPWAPRWPCVWGGRGAPT